MASKIFTQNQKPKTKNHLLKTYTPVYPENRGQTALEWQSIAASVARRCGLRPQGLCDVHCLGLAVCDTTELAPCCPLPEDK